MYGLELTDKELSELAQEVHTFTMDKSNDGVNVHKLAKKLREQSQMLFQRLNDDIPAVADEIERLISASHGHAAALFTSSNAMGQVHAILKNRHLPFPLFWLDRGGTHAIEQFKKSGNGVLLASGSLWEGIDIPGDSLSMLIIVKLPFQVPDPIGDYERSLCGDMETHKRRAVIPDMIIKLVQGFGRLIRKETDTGVVAILDCRANERGAYRRVVLQWDCQ